MSTFEKVKKSIVDSTGTPEDRVVPEARLVDDLGLDSLDSLELVMDLETEFGCEIDDEAWDPVNTVQDVVDVIEKVTKGA